MYIVPGSWYSRSSIEIAGAQSGSDILDYIVLPVMLETGDLDTSVHIYCSTRVRGTAYCALRIVYVISLWS